MAGPRRTRGRVWLCVFLFAVAGGVGFLYVQHRRQQAEVDWEIRAFHSRLEAERGVSMSPSAKEARRIAREEAERVVREHDR